SHCFNNPAPMLRCIIHKSAPFLILIESFAYVLPAALAHASAIGTKARCEIVSASVTVRQMRFIGFLRRIWVKGEKKARLGCRLREGVLRQSRSGNYLPMASGQ